jgi:hypothetical protein
MPMIVREIAGLLWGAPGLAMNVYRLAGDSTKAGSRVEPPARRIQGISLTSLIYINGGVQASTDNISVVLNI